MVTTEVPGPFKVECKTYILADLVTIVEGKGRESIELHDGKHTYLWKTILIIIIGVVLLAWLVRKKWPLVAVLIYSCWITIAFIPFTFFIGFLFAEAGDTELLEIDKAIMSIYTSGWSFWIFCVVMIISQILLLGLPIKIVKQRPISKKSIWSTALGAAVFFALIIIGLIWSIGSAILGDDIIEAVPLWAVLIFLLYNWALWAWIFRGFARKADTKSYIRRLMKWLLHGSILELLVAVPSHIIVRHKDVCCAHGITALGIAMGLAAMLLSFGPGIYFLYAERIENKKNNKTQ